MKMFLTATLLAGLLGAPVLAQDAAKGERIFKRCSACHQVGATAKNRTGPVLSDVVGRVAGSYEGYNYSSSMQAAGAAGLVWTQDNIAQYLEKPTAYLREFLGDGKARAKMTFKLKKAGDRLDVAAYLAQFQTATAEPSLGAAFCIVNASETEYLFATETREGVRQITSLAPGARLCAAETAAVDGIVSVFNGEDDFEGCSRIIAAGTSEEMLEYGESGRCGWSSHNS